MGNVHPLPYVNAYLTGICYLCIVGNIAVCKKSVQTLFMYRSINEVVRLAALNKVLVSSSRSTSNRFRADKSSASFLSNLKTRRREVASGILSEWHRSAKALTPSNLLSSSRTFNGEYSSSGIIKS